MTRLAKSVKFPAAMIIAIVILSFALTSCSGIVGFGDIIDFEDPVLFIDPGTNPRYIKLGTTITGDCFDNVGVTRVECRDSVTGLPFEYVSEIKITGTRWSISFNFSPAQNGEKYTLQIEAYDRVGNCGEMSIRSVSIYVDITPPAFSDVMILRSPTRTADLETYAALSALAAPTGDPRGLNPLNIDRYQNGSFWISARVSEEETRIVPETLRLKVFDWRHGELDDDWVYNRTRDSGSIFAPRWVVSEDDLIQGAAASSDPLRPGKTWTEDYEAALTAGGKLFFFIVLEAQDMAGNKVVEDFGFFCINREADIPKARLGNVFDAGVLPGTQIPVEAFDDDKLEIAYIDLLTKAQFSGLAKPTDSTDEDIVKTIWEKIESSDPLAVNYKGLPIAQHIAAGTFYEQLNVTIEAGENDSDYGDYIIIAILKDRKDDPHKAPAGGDIDELSVWGYYALPLSVTDNNNPLIVIDTVDTTLPLLGSLEAAGLPPRLTYDRDRHLGYDPAIPKASTGDSPEENTFPKLDGGRYFTLNGYTLRAAQDSSTLTGVPGASGADTNCYITEFKVAWIPYFIEYTAGGSTYRGQDSDYILKAVQNHLRSATNPLPPGVQVWDMHDYTDTTEDSYFINGTPQEIPEGSGNWYIKQAFRKKFDVLGDLDDIHTSVRNFHYDCPETKVDIYGRPIPPADLLGYGRENKPKLLVLYAKDRDSHTTFKTIRLLGNESPPALKIYDLTNDGVINLPPDFEYDRADASGGGKEAQNDYYGDVKALYTAGSSAELKGYMQYPRGTTIKIYALSEVSGDIGIDTLDIYDVTRGEAAVANMRGSTTGLPTDATYTEELPDVTQRVLLFRAKNKLGVEVELQRTVAATTTAMLNEIGTSLASGTYGANENMPPPDGNGGILLRAQFSGSVVVPAGRPAPKLRIRYETGGNGSNVWKYQELTWDGENDKASMYLDFVFTVPPDANGRLQTIDDSNKPAVTTWTYPGYPIYIEGWDPYAVNRPDPSIVDAVNSSPAFLPGYNYPNWGMEMGRGGEYSLQGMGPADRRGKLIVLDGLAPTITAFKAEVGLKTPYTANQYYYRGGETITFSLKASKTIRPGGDGNPRIAFNLVNLANGVTSGPHYTTRVLPVGTDEIHFLVGVSELDIPAGVLTQAGELRVTGFNRDNGDILDVVGNSLNAVNVVTLYNAGTNIIRVDRKAPAAITPSVAGATPSSTAKNTYSDNPVLVLTPDTTDEIYGVTQQYSLDGGFSWVNYPDEKAGWTSNSEGPLKIASTDRGMEWRLQVRQIDRAGNVSPPSPTYRLEVNAVFPQIVSISIDEVKGIFNEGTTLTVNLDFEYPVVTNDTYTGANRAYIILTNMNPGTSTTEGLNTVKLYADSQQDITNSTLHFTWDNITGKEMQDGVTISEINLWGNPANAGPAVVDVYNNRGVKSYSAEPWDYTIPATPVPGYITMYATAPATGGGTWVDTPPATALYQVPNLNGREYIVDAIRPYVVSSNPTSGGVMTNLGEVSITFNEPVRKEQGTIQIRPYGDFAVPPVFSADEFYEIYYAIPPAATSIINSTTRNLRQSLIAGNFSNPTLSLVNGLGVGPYRLNTHGLIPGDGYKNNNSTTYSTSSSWNATWNGVTDPEDPAYDPFMVPDTRDKYVLLYEHDIWDTTTDLQFIRAALREAKFRTYEFDVNNDNVVLSNGNKTVTIQLDKPLPEGLQWELYYPEGTFTDDPAGNPASASDATSEIFWFWTDGVQQPVIRIDRKSMDYRSMADRRFADNNNAHPDDALQWTNTTTGTTPAITTASFATAAFKAESETPGATVSYSTLQGAPTGAAATPGTYSAMDMYWTGNVAGSSPARNWNNSTTTTDTSIVTGSGATNIAAIETMGTFILPNMVFRAISGKAGDVKNGTGPNPGLSYTLIEKGITKTYQGLGNLYLLRSYNRDATKKELDGLATWKDGTAGTSVASDSISIAQGTGAIVRASKNYVVAKAVRGAFESLAGNAYEGVFVTVVALRHPNTDGNGYGDKVFDAGGNAGQPTQIFGSNTQGPTPTIAGFPMMLQNSDLRYMKLLTSYQNDMYWISTEIVSSWFVQFCSTQNGSDIMSRPFQSFGEVGRLLTGGYGDLTFSYNQDIK